MGFQSRVLHTQFHPDHLLFAALPELIQEFATRREERVRVNLPAVLHLSEGQREMVRIRDISSGGCGLYVSNPTHRVEVGATVQVMVQLPGEQRFTPVTGVVRQSKPLAGEGKEAWWVGLQFEYDVRSEHIRDRIQRLTEAPSVEMSLSDL